MKRVVACGMAMILGVALVHSQGGVDVWIDAAANAHPIDERIYGLAFADAATMADLRTPFERWGGNATTRYNWQANGSNRASDYFFESIADPSPVPGASADAFISAALSAGAYPALTIPTIGWVAKLGNNRSILPSFSVSKYGPQTATDPYFSDAGNGISSLNGQPITGNNPNDAHIVSNPAFQQSFVQHLIGQWGNAASGGVGYYVLDNEPSLWHVTHRDVHPTGATMDEVADAFRTYGGMIKASDHGGLILGPEEWGWSGYFYSGFDQQSGAAHGFGFLPDRSAHAGADYLPWFLDQMRQSEAATGQRLLDVFTVHFYPQGGQYSNDTSIAMQRLRNRSTRALWDPSYVDESWIGTPVQLVPRLKNWVATYYPGTRIGITEYSWGAEGHINGATTLADVLGIFGREGVDLASYWTAPAQSTPAYKAIKLYRNYDNHGSRFGNTSVSAIAPQPDTLAVFAATRASDGALTIMAINKELSAQPASLHLAHFNAGGSAKVWQLTSANTIAQLSDLPLTSSSSALSVTLPAQSVTLFVVPARQVVDVSAQVRVTSSGILLNRTSGTFNGTVTVTNTTSQTLAGPLQLAITNLSSGVTLASPTGSVGGSPYLTLSAAGLSPGSSASVAVAFVNPSKGKIAFTPIVYSGKI